MKITEFFKIVEGATVFNYTSSDSDIVHLGDTYTPIAMGRTEVETKNELSRANVELSFSLDSEIGKRYMKSVIDTIVSLTIFSKQDATVNVTWKGRLASVKPQDSNVKLVFESVFTSLRRPGLRRRFQRNCPHVLYGRGCRLNKDDFDAAGVATFANGANYIVTGAGTFADGWFTGGMLKAPDGTFRFIIGHSGNNITLIRPIDSLTEAIAGGSQPVTLYPGCDRSPQTCQGKFNNLANNGSFQFIPTRNPFSGSSFA